MSSRLPVALLLTVTAAAFSPSLGASFHLDDITLFSDPVITSHSGWWYIWRPLQTRPLTLLRFWLNYQLGGQNAAGYHALNILLHVLATWLVYRLIARIAGRKAAYLGAALFALHPIQAEAVNYVFERATLLAAVFCLLSAHAWLDGAWHRAIGSLSSLCSAKKNASRFHCFS